ncbi:MAG: ASCH domain-containing protein [Candidatus Helarchaeota archaeon]
MSIKPKFSRLIFSGQKKYELRKTPIKNERDRLVIVYESAPTKAIVCAFRIKKTLKQSPTMLWNTLRHEIGISKDEFFGYFKDRDWGYALKIAHPVLFKKRISLEELRMQNIEWQPPQNFQYLRNDSEIFTLLKDELFSDKLMSEKPYKISIMNQQKISK